MEVSVEFVAAFLLLVLPALFVAGYKLARNTYPIVVGQLSDFVHQNLPDEALYLLEQAATMAVRAAEQAEVKEQLLKTGEEKLAYALDILQTFLNEAGFGAINVKVLEAAIRAALNQELHKSPPQPVEFPFELVA